MKRVISLIFIVFCLLFGVNTTIYGYPEPTNTVFVYEYKNEDTYGKIKDAVKIYCEKYDVENTENIIYGMEYNDSIPIVAEYNEKYIKIYITELTENQKSVQTSKILKTILNELKSTIENKELLDEFVYNLVDSSPKIANIIYPMTSPGPSANSYKIYKLVNPILYIIEILIIIAVLLYIIFFIVYILKNRKKENFVLSKKKKVLFISVILLFLLYTLLGSLRGIISIILVTFVK